ncbi:hypothetical protein C0989_007827 [Termitomyces sp. Mn162]|nr:hypothetical protein C0989_007827 [Termitomyces sp. Mn162]
MLVGCYGLHRHGDYNDRVTFAVSILVLFHESHILSFQIGPENLRACCILPPTPLTYRYRSSAIAEATHTPSSASSMSAVNTAAVVGGVVGSVILILILAILFVLIKRKDRKKRKRLTFKRDLMIKHRPLAPDIEEGHAVGTSPILPPLSFQQAITVPTPQGHVRSEFSASVSQTPVHTDPPTYRQVQLGAQIIQIERQMSSIRRQSRGQEGMETVLEHMKKQVEWLRAERDSPWARCETDVPPP